MIKSFKHKGLQKFFEEGTTAGIQAAHSVKLNLQLAALSSAIAVTDLKTPRGWCLHRLSGDLQDYWSLTVSGNWRVIFKFEDGDVYVVDYLDYH